jgi:hypothetical protein
MNQAQISFVALTGLCLGLGGALLFTDHLLAGGLLVGWAVFSHFMLMVMLLSDARSQIDTDEPEDIDPYDRDVKLD